MQIENFDNSKNKDAINKENELLKKKVEELYQENVHLKKNINHKVKSQLITIMSSRILKYVFIKTFIVLVEYKCTIFTKSND